MNLFKFSVITLLFALNALFAAADPVGVSSGRPLTLRSEVNVSDSQVCLSDLFDETWVQLRCPKNNPECCPWKVNSETAKITLDRATIESALKKASVSITGTTLTGAESVSITQTHRLISVEEVRSKIINKISLSSVAGSGRIGVSEISLEGPVYLKIGDTSWDVVVPEEITRNMTVKIESNPGYGTAFLGWARIKLSLEDKVFIAKRTVRSGEPLTDELFEQKTIDLFSAQQVSGQTSSIVRSFEFPKNMRARSLIPGGSVLSFSSIERTPAVHLGDAVTLVLRSENLRISTKGIAQGAAAPGEMISVQLRSFGRTFRGKLNDGKVVEVWL